jgi:hypothetical protein
MLSPRIARLPLLALVVLPLGGLAMAAQTWMDASPASARSAVASAMHASRVLYTANRRYIHRWRIAGRGGGWSRTGGDLPADGSEHSALMGPIAVTGRGPYTVEARIRVVTGPVGFNGYGIVALASYHRPQVDGTFGIVNDQGAQLDSDELSPGLIDTQSLGSASYHPGKSVSPLSIVRAWKRLCLLYRRPAHRFRRLYASHV